ncbi:hypothetical protein P7I87_01035 [Pseudomonas aeruginosa]|nr:hypothetical protein [Pseudomonas aeruginosa]WGW53477.1 hypothetical protein P7I87_01035 [Pseudomonas aeruginosa]
MDRQFGREVMGVVQGGSVLWRLGRQRGWDFRAPETALRHRRYSDRIDIRIAKCGAISMGNAKSADK